MLKGMKRNYKLFLSWPGFIYLFYIQKLYRMMLATKNTFKTI